jgi:hypothetical protein
MSAVFIILTLTANWMMLFNERVRAVFFYDPADAVVFLVVNNIILAFALWIFIGTIKEGVESRR